MTPPEAEITELPSSPGARLRREREARGLSEQQAAETLNLDPTVLTALEANDFGALGAPVFVKGHLRRYAMLLGLAEDEVVGAYERSKLQVDEPSLVPKSRLEMAPVRGRPRWPWVLGGLAAFLGAAALLSYVSQNGLPWSDVAPDAGTVATPPDALTLPGPATPAATGGAATGDESTGSGGSVAGGSGSVPETGATAAPTEAASTVPVPVAGPGQVSLQLRFSADSWVEVFDGSGKAVLYDLGQSGSERTITATAPLSVTLGNAPAVAVSVNGRLQPAPRAQGTVARFSVAADGSVR